MNISNRKPVTDYKPVYFQSVRHHEVFWDRGLAYTKLELNYGVLNDPERPVAKRFSDLTMVLVRV